MDILSFVNSPDMQKYFRKIKFKPTPVQAATIIARSCRPFMERMQALSDLIDTTKDCCVRGDEGAYDSLHNLLNSYLARAISIRNEFWHKSGLWYAEYDNGDVLSKASPGFSSPDTCIDWVKEKFGPTDIPHHFAIVKTHAPDFGKITATFDSQLRAIEYVATDMSIQDERIQTYFETVFATFPTPFVRGDVLTQVNGNNRFGDRLIVLDKMDQWNAATLRQNGIPNRKLNEDEASETAALPQLDKYPWWQYEVYEMAHNRLEMETEANDIMFYEYADALSSHYDKDRPSSYALVSGYTFEYGRVEYRHYALDPLGLCYAAPPSKNSERLLWEISKYLKNKIDAVELLNNFKTICYDHIADIQHKKHRTLFAGYTLRLYAARRSLYRRAKSTLVIRQDGISSSAC